MIKTHAPGTLMLFGEHAVLRGKLAIATSVKKYISVELAPRKDNIIHIHSNLGEHTCSLETIEIKKPFHFVLACFKYFKSTLPSGCNITIHSEFSHTVGLGSSAAITVATVAAISHWLKQSCDKQKLFLIGREIIQSVQGLGSGADVAACTFGGVVAYQMKPLSITQLPHLPKISLVYSGSKTPTVDVVNFVNQQEQQSPDTFQQHFDTIDHCSKLAKDQIEQQDWQALATTMARQQLILKAMQLSTPLIDELIEHATAETLGAKISGSGLGDCIITLGELPENTFPKTKQQQQSGVKQMNVELENQGVSIESN